MTTGEKILHTTATAQEATAQEATTGAAIEATIISGEAETARPCLLTDMGNAQRFAKQHAGKVAYNGAMGWLLWTGTHWRRDGGAVMQHAKATAWEIYAEAQRIYTDAAAAVAMAKATGQAIATGEMDAKSKEAGKKLAWANTSQDARRLAQMVRLAQTEPGIEALPALFDSDPMALNCKNGLVDLRTGELIAHDPAAYCSKIAPVDYDPAATCPTWERFIAEITGNDADLAAFLRRAAGYTLTGNTGEQALFFAYGVGANGKSTFLGILAAILGDYATKIPSDALMMRDRNTTGNASPELARLAGARLVLASELDDGRRLSESTVKDMTGGDMITARHLRQEYFDFKPAFKLWIYGNHKPLISGTDEGIWRRVKQIPFTVTIPASRRDKALFGKLWAEASGILAWAVRGCLEWQRGGLGDCKAVNDATKGYKDSMDVIGRFLAERCITEGKDLKCKFSELRAAYEAWAAAAGEPVLGGRRFGDYLTDHGFYTDKGAGNASLRRGLGLRSQ